MAARWKPPDIVGLGEYIGRRLFTRETLAGAADQPKPAELYEMVHFEPGDDDEVSLDRLGRGNVEPKVRGYLEPRALFSAGRMRKASFLGWAVTRARNLAISPRREFPNLPVHASPVPNDGADELSENIYHAHVVRPDPFDHYYTALHLREIFLRENHFEAAVRMGPEERPPWYIRAYQGLLKGWQKLKGKLHPNNG